MDNHLHVLVRLDPDVAKGWSDEQVVRRWEEYPQGALRDISHPGCASRHLTPRVRCATLGYDLRRLQRLMR
jgi:hypothetical protein